MNKHDILKMMVSRVEKEIRDTPYDKSSEHHHAVLKTKLAKLKDQLEGPVNRGGGGGVGYAIKHSGDASVVLVGLPSVGKSTLLNKLTNAESKVGNYDFTTLGVVPGMMEYKGIKVQILDLPGIIEGAAENKGFGRKVLSVIRAADLIILMTDINRLEWLKRMRDELYKAGVRLNKQPPKIWVKRMGKGGVQVVDPFRNMPSEVVEDVAKEMGLDNAVIQIGEKIGGVDELIDVLIKSRTYLPLVEVVSKIDLGKKVNLPEEAVGISAEKGVGLDELKEQIWRKLGLVRVYLKRSKTGEADKQEPLVMRRGQTLDDVLVKISNQMREDVSRACIWGEKARFPGQEVSFSYEVFDQMEVWFGR